MDIDDDRPGQNQAGDREPGDTAGHRPAQPTLTAVTARGEKIVLRLPGRQDLPELIRTCLDPETLRWTTVPLGYDEQKALEFINGYAPAWWRRDAGGCWAITSADDGYLGQIDLRRGADRAVAHVGFLTSPNARGRGYMSAALRTVAEFGLRELGLGRIVWQAFVGNVASRRVAEKAGFRMEGVARLGCAHRGRRVDCWVAALVRDDLTAR